MPLAHLSTAQSPITLPINANMDIYRLGPYDDLSDGIAPAICSFAASAGRTITFSSASGTWDCGTPPLSAVLFGGRNGGELPASLMATPGS